MKCQLRVSFTDRVAATALQCTALLPSPVFRPHNWPGKGWKGASPPPPLSRWKTPWNLFIFRAFLQNREHDLLNDFRLRCFLFLLGKVSTGNRTRVTSRDQLNQKRLLRALITNFIGTRVPGPLRGAHHFPIRNFLSVKLITFNSRNAIFSRELPSLESRQLSRKADFASEKTPQNHVLKLLMNEIVPRSTVRIFRFCLSSKQNLKSYNFRKCNTCPYISVC